MVSIFDQEYAVNRYGEEMRAEGALEQAKATALKLKKIGFSEGDIAAIHNVNPQTVHQWLTESSAEPLKG